MRWIGSGIMTNLLLLGILIALGSIIRSLYFHTVMINEIENTMPQVPAPCGHDDVTPCHVYIVPH